MLERIIGERRLYDRAAVQPDLDLVSAALGALPRSFEPQAQGGYTRSESWRVETADGAAFVKQAEDEGSLHMLRREALVYQHVRGPFLPSYIGFADAGDRAALAIELLEGAQWPPPYPADVTPLFAALEQIAGSPVPPGLPALSQPHRWELIADDPGPLLGLGLCSQEWLEHALPALSAAEAAAVIEGDELVHGDVYSGNVAFVGDQAVLVDWGACVQGSRWTDVAFAVLSVRVEGGILPGLDFPDEPAYAAATAGILALEAPKPPPEWTPPDSTLREDMIGDLAHALRWAAEKLELLLP
jgi:aminoglycoside phosphotransferase